MSTRHAALFALALTATAISPALSQPPASVTVTNAWARATPPGAKTGVVYMTLTSRTADTLVAITSPAAPKAELHEMTMDGNVMRMRAIEGGLKLPAGQAVTLQPGGNHIMLMGLQAPLMKGQSVHLHLTFEHAPALDVDAPIAAIGAAGPAMGSQGHAMHGM